MTNNLLYEDYGVKYLEILRRATCPTCPPITDTDDKYRGILLRQDPFKTEKPPSKTLVGALYYTVESERSKFRANGLSKPQLPTIGGYDAINSNIVTAHLQQSRQGNIGVWIVEWYGLNSQQDTLLRNQILNRNDLQDLKVSILYQVRSRINEQTWDMSQVQTDMNHFFTNVATSPYYYKVEGRPIIFLSLTRWFFSKNKLQDLVTIIRDAAKANKIDKVYLVGDQVWSSAPIVDDYKPFQMLDAVANIDVYGNMQNQPPSTAYEAVTGFYERQRDWRNYAWKAGCGYVPSVIAGFNNRAYESGRDDPIISRQLNATSPPGSFFALSLERARYLVDSTLSGLIIVSSFNRFREDTQIESLVGESTNLPTELTQGETYRGYGDLYLNILAQKTQEYNTTVVDNDEEYNPKSNELFYSLQCNVVNVISKKNCKTKWTDLFGPSKQHDSLVQIPCGQCIILDQNYPHSELILNGGIDVLGMLYIRLLDNQNVSITTPFIR